MADTSSPASRVNESFQLPRQNGRIDTNASSSMKKGGAYKRTNVVSNVSPAKMTKQNITSKNHRNSKSEKLHDAAESIVCNGEAKDSPSVDR